jgi:8-oxo-dGTP pyrophosphatase MutT (NUDIX family)
MLKCELASFHHNHMTTCGSSVIIINDQNQVLLILREDLRIWALPGGSIESGETFEDAARREVLEETGYHIAVTKKVGIYWRPQYPGGGNIVHVFLGEIINGNTSAHDWESIEVKWFDLDTLPKKLFLFAREHIHDAVSETIPIYKEQRLPNYQAFLLKVLLIIRNFRNRLIYHTCK